ncbi:Uncharacterised protein [Mycobacteroides abscessus subsp. abscessus]|nr:Uncharacterised protein [Mycobacteroides abscessus subsp. abscessus]
MNWTVLSVQLATGRTTRVSRRGQSSRWTVWKYFRSASGSALMSSAMPANELEMVWSCR